MGQILAKGDHRPRASLWDRFHDKIMVDHNSGCWLWTAALKETGYGVIGLGGRELGIEKAHRVAYCLYKGPIPEGGNVLHSCDVPSCVNPDHLRIGTLSDNMQDCVKRGRNFRPDNRGERSSSAILNTQQVLDIRRRARPARSYAEQYGVKKRTIYAIWRGDLWAHV